MHRLLQALVVALLASAPLSAQAASFADLPDPTLSRALDAVVLQIDQATRDYFDLPEGETGALVLAIGQGGIAEVYGIRPGDLVTAVSDVPFAFADEIDAIVWAFMNTRKFSFAWSIKRGSEASTVAFPLVETHFQESYLVRDIPGWPSWAEWSANAPQGWAAYASAHLSDFERNFEGPPVCRSCGAAPAAVAASESADPEVEPADSPIAVTPVPEPVAAPPALPAVVSTEPAPAAEPGEPTAATMVQPVPDQPMLFDPPATAGEVGGNAATSPGMPSAGEQNSPIAPVGEIPSSESSSTALARVPRPAPARPAFDVLTSPESGVATETDQAVAPPPDVTPVIEPSAIAEPIAPAGVPANSRGVEAGDLDFCTRFPATCRVYENGYGGGAGDGDAGGGREGGGGAGGREGGDLDFCTRYPATCRVYENGYRGGAGAGDAGGGGGGGGGEGGGGGDG